MTDAGAVDEPIALLEEGRRREKEQTLFYRGLAAEAEEEGRAAESERLNGLHADEQHHLSRLTARVLELGGLPTDLRDVRRPDEGRGLGGEEPVGWEAVARSREAAEVAWYESTLATSAHDPETRLVLEEILASERRHAEVLGGKWMLA